MNPSDNELSTLRAGVDELDTQLLDLLNARAATVARIFQLKSRQGSPRFSAVRTQDILERLVRINRGPLSEIQVRELFGLILEYFGKRYSP